MERFWVWVKVFLAIVLSIAAIGFGIAMSIGELLVFGGAFLDWFNNVR